MLTLAFPSRNSSGWLPAIALALGVVASVALVALFWHGAPSRMLLTIAALTLLATPILMRWQTGWWIIFSVFPLVDGFRRVYLIYDASRIPTGMNDPLDILPDLLLGFMVVGYLVSRRQKKAGPPIEGERKLAVPLILLMILSAVEVFNPHMGSLLGGLNGFRIFTLWIFWYFMTRDMINSSKQINQWISISLLLGAATGLYGTYQYVFGFPSYDQTWANLYGAATQTIGDSMRAFSTFSFTSTFSHYMIICACIALMAMRKKDLGPFVKLLSPFFLACVLMGLAFTFVRSSYGGLIIAGVIGLIMSGNKKGRGKRLILTFIAAFVLLQVVPKSAGELRDETLSDSQLVTQRVMTLTDPTQVGSMAVRFGAWKNVLDHSFQYPFGIGLGAGPAVRLGGSGDISAMAYTESQYFTELAELGWPGLILFLWVVCYGFLYSVRVHDRLIDPDLKRVARMCLMIQAGILVTATAGGTVLYAEPGAPYYWASLGLIGALERLDARHPVAEDPNAPRMVAGTR